MKLILATAALALMASTAMAADLIVEEEAVVDVPAAGYDWSGAYVGVTAGFGVLTADQPLSESDPYWYGTYYGNHEITGDGFSAGVGAGANAQFGSFVLGLDGDINWTNLEASADYEGEYYKISSQWDWYATLRAKAGIAIDSLLLYATAGVAAVNTTYSYCYYADCSDYSYDESYTQTQFGVVAGVGAEVAVSDDISLKGEVLYIGLPTETVASPYYEYDADFTTSAVVGRVGLNWHF